MTVHTNLENQKSIGNQLHLENIQVDFQMFSSLRTIKAILMKYCLLLQSIGRKKKSEDLKKKSFRVIGHFPEQSSRLIIDGEMHHI